MKNRQVVGLGRTAEILAWKKNQVLKLFRDGWSLSAVKWEERVARAVSEAGLPVPAVHGIVEVDGRHGIVYDHVEGQSMLKEFVAKPEELEHFARLFAELHVKMHSVMVGSLPSQRRRLEEKIHKAKLLPEKARNAALKALHQLTDGCVLCHGDFHPDNILMSKQGPIVIDWNDATQGNPMADIARTLLLLSPGKKMIVGYLTENLGLQTEIHEEEIRSSLNMFVETYLERYAQIRDMSLEEVELWRLPVTAARLSEGIKEEESRLLSIVKANLQT